MPNIVHRRRRARHPIFRIAGIAFLGLLLFVDSIPAANQVDIRFDPPGWFLGPDTIIDQVPIQLEIWIENDQAWKGFNFGLELRSPDGASWRWHDVCVDNELVHVTVVPGSRLDPVDDIFDITGLKVDDYNIDGSSPDTIMISGLSSGDGLPPGPLEYMLSIRIAIDTTYVHPLFCIDSAFVPPAGAFVFVDTAGIDRVPTTLWSDTGKCWIVEFYRCIFPGFDPGLPNTMTVSHCATGSVILSGTPSCGSISRFILGWLCNGNGEAVVTDYNDGTCMVSYSPAPTDVGRDITIAVETYSDEWPPFFFPHYISVDVVNHDLAVDCGWNYIDGASNNPITKTDITGVENNCDRFTYYIVSGPGQIDASSAEYSWIPGPEDIGLHTVEVGAAEGIDSAQCSFTVEVIDENCCPGDANYTGNVNVADAVFLINYVFKNGPPPHIRNWGDPNADCTINVGDVVYLINYVFRSGTAPQPGCVY